MTPPGSRFEAPLDLLLDEVRRQKVPIEDIAMAPVAARFLEHVRTAAQCNLNLDVEWLHMAATLIHWKSRALLPADANQQTQADPIRDDLVRQLLAHRNQAAEELARRQSLEQIRFSRAAGGEFCEEPVTDRVEQPGFVSIWNMIQQARDLARWVEEHRGGQSRWREIFTVENEVTVEDMVEYLRPRLTLSAGEKMDGMRLLEAQPTASRQRCLFLAMLEMARDQQLEIEQNEEFGSISLACRPAPAAAINPSGAG